MNLLTTEHLAHRWGVTRKHVTDRVITRPDFPRPARQIGSRLRWWRAEDVEAWEACGANRGRDGH